MPLHFVGETIDKRRAHAQAQAGALLQLIRGVYVDASDDIEAAVLGHAVRIAHYLYPAAYLSSASAALLAPTPDGRLFISGRRNQRTRLRALEIVQNEAPSHPSTMPVIVGDDLGELRLAASSPRQRFLEITDQQWDEMQDINLKSMFRLSQLALQPMMAARAGKIVNISSVTFFLGVGNLAHYTASKGGVIGLTRSLAREAGPHNVHVNCVTPGFIQTASEVRFVNDDEARTMVADQCLARRITPLDVARVCQFLACELSDGMTGQCLNVDGGWVMH